MRTKQQILTDVLGSPRRSSEEYLYKCPFCEHHKHKLSVNFDKNVYKCWVCNATGKSIGRLVRQFGSFDAKQEWSLHENDVDLSKFEELFETKKPQLETIINLPEEFESLANRTLIDGSEKPLKYLYERGITREDILKWKIGWCPSGPYYDRIVVPSFNNDGWVNYFISRSFTGAFPKYKNPQASRNIIFNELYVDWDKPITLVEGVFDAIKADNAVPLLGSTLTENSKLFQEIIKRNATVYLALDGDAKKKEMDILEMLLTYGNQVYMVDVDGFNDVGEMTKQEFQLRKKEASFIDQSNYLLTKMFSF
jgi:DNA primase